LIPLPKEANLASTELAPGKLTEAPPRRTPKAKSRATNENYIRRRLARLGWGFSAPALIFIAVVTIFPIVFSIILSFQNVNQTGSGFALQGGTLQNYHDMVTDPLWRHSLYFTFMYTVVTVLAEVIVGTIFALILERLTRGRGIMMAMLLIPWSLITVVSAQLWSYIYSPTYGVLDGFFKLFNISDVLSSPLSATIALMFADIWKTTPFVTIIVLAGLVMIPQELLEASSVDGASAWKSFWRITVPLLRPTLGIAVLFRVLQAFGLFDLPYVLIGPGGGPSSLLTSIAMYTEDQIANLQPGWAAAVSTSTALIVVALCMVFGGAFKQQVGKEAINA
jgi:multiple sugar transport system permease protein